MIVLLILPFLFYLFISHLHKLSLKSSSSSSYGPPSHPFIGCLFSFYQNRHRLLDWYTDLLSESPTQTISLRRLGAARTVVTANPANVEYVLKTNFANYPKGKAFTEILGDLLGCGIFNVDGGLWSVQRKFASHEFSTKSLKEFVVKVLEDEVETRLVPLLRECGESEKVLDLQEVLRRFTFDTICKVSLGIDPCCLDLSSPLPPLVMAFDLASEVSAMRGSAPVFAVWKIKRALNIGSEKRLKEAIRVVHGSVEEIIEMKRRELEENSSNPKGEGNDLLTRLLVAGLQKEMVRDMVISFIMAGRDTTAAAMTWLFWALSKNSNIEEAILNEVKTLQEKRMVMDYETLKQMNFLKACLCESMRLYPPVAWDSKHAVADDTLPDGTPVRKGDRITYFPYGMGRMEALWGKDKDEFKPDRWFAAPGSELSGGEGLKQVSPFKYPVFQAGPRVCLGKEMAFIQMKYVMASVIRQFEIRTVGDERRPPAFVPLLTAHMAGGLKVVVKERHGGAQKEMKL